MSRYRRKTYGEKDFKGVQISSLTKDKIKIALAVEAWAEECQKLHRRECPENQCAGRSKIWWLVRHPEVSPQHADETAKAYVRERTQVCQLLLDRLATPEEIQQDHDRNLSSSKKIRKNHGAVQSTSTMINSETPFLPWLPGEKNVYINRTVEETAQLLGHEFYGNPSEVRTVSAGELIDPFPGARAAMPLETAAQRRARENREDWQRRKQDAQERTDRGLEAPRSYVRPRGTGNGLADATAALRKR